VTSDPRRLVHAALSEAAAAAGVFWELDEARARRDVEAVLRRRREGTDLRMLDGVPVAVKDAFAVSGRGQHLGLTRALVSDRDAAAVVKLRDAGAIVIGTTAMDQLAWTMTGQTPGYPPCENPLLPGRSPGGSSGGAAAAVAAGIVPLALGVDSAGSVRVPAAWCGVVGFKPSFGAIDLEGCAPLAPCLDTAGIIARHVDDCRPAFTALSVPGPQAAGEPAAPRVGIPTALIAGVECDPIVLGAWRRTLDALGSAGFALREVGAPPTIRGIGALFAANLAARWGDVVDAEPRDLVHPDVRAGVEYGRTLTVRDYLGACDALAAARRNAASLFAEVDLLALPTAPVPPPPLGDPAPVSVASAFTRPWNAFGCPAVTVPCALADCEGCAVQLIAGPGDDIRLLGWASRVQEVIEGRGVAASAELRNRREQ
jgi:Asp-tRNA(Asn)/Glu-tRNA(Gln) amidotransferase A subunit family amidase